ncbi:MAG: hypothetical protein AABX01_02430 [Candidatus Micrarchaeota archaeon]
MDIVVNVDDSGRVVLPKEIRKQVPARKFIVEVVTEHERQELVFKPILRARDFLGSMPRIDVAGFKKEHDADD